jgi:hypothetical protein
VGASYPLILLVPQIRAWFQEEWAEVEGKRKRKVGKAYYRERTAELLSLGYSQ